MTTSVIRAGGTGVAGVQTTGGDDGALALKVGPLAATVEALNISSTGTGAFVGQVTATGFTGTLDGILGSGTPAAATVTTIDASGVVTATDTVGSSYNQFYALGNGNVGGIRFGNTTVTNGYIYYDNGANMNFNLGGEKMRITSAGNVGIGTAAPSGAFHVKGGRSFHAAANEPFALAAAYDATGGSVYFGAKSGSATPDAQISAASGAALMTLQNNGYIGIGTGTPAYKLDVFGTQRVSGIVGGVSNAAGNFHVDSGNVQLPATNILTGSFYINYSYGTGGIRCMNGAGNYGTAYAAAFSVVSDRRLKENISYFDSGLAKILQLKPATFDFINGENNQKGFIAQDVETVIPEVVRSVDTLINIDTGETKEYLSVDKAAMVPYLVAAIKEQQVTIEALTARITALEG